MLDPKAIVHPEAKLAPSVRVDPFAVIDRGVTLGDDCVVHSFAYVGGPPGHVTDRGEGTTLEVGARTVVREYVSLHRGSNVGSGRTVIGPDCHFMPYAHVGHDCRVGRGVVMTNGSMLGGHCEVEDFVVFGGAAAVHQFCRVGTMAMVGGGSIASQDIPPYCTVAGNRVRLAGLNEVGLERRRVSKDVIQALRRAYRILFRTAGTRAHALERVRAEFGSIAEVAHLADFVASSRRGIPR
ncbi:MAG: acyl-ACP--UDP-N-acetylglucosamine O-acyltransferase [Planctomycetes bacterium]|nr:acyl-ACP--UDP-N-acetylglucosamine O-acyltransferase [Planctomycetota bacterium]